MSDYLELKEKAANEGLVLRREDYLFAYAHALGETMRESYIMSAAEVDKGIHTGMKPKQVATILKRERLAKKKKSYDDNYRRAGGNFAKRPAVEWIAKELAIIMPQKIKAYLKRNPVVEGMIKKEIEFEELGTENISVDEIQQLVAVGIRKAKNEGDNVALADITKLTPLIKLVLDKLQPIDTTQDDLDRTIIEVFPPANHICQWCNREVYIHTEGKEEDEENEE